MGVPPSWKSHVTFVFPSVSPSLRAFSARKMLVVHGFSLVLEHCARFLGNRLAPSAHQNLSEREKTHIVWCSISTTVTFFACGWRRWPIVLFLGSSVFAAPSLLNAFGSTDGPSAFWSARRNDARTSARQRMTKGLLLSKLWLLEWEDCVVVSSQPILAAAWECSWKKSASFLSFADWVVSGRCPSSRKSCITRFLKSLYTAKNRSL